MVSKDEHTLGIGTLEQHIFMFCSPELHHILIPKVFLEKERIFKFLIQAMSSSNFNSHNIIMESWFKLVQTVFHHKGDIKISISEALGGLFLRFLMKIQIVWIPLSPHTCFLYNKSDKGKKFSDYYYSVGQENFSTLLFK